MPAFSANTLPPGVPPGDAVTSELLADIDAFEPASCDCDTPAFEVAPSTLGATVRHSCGERAGLECSAPVGRITERSAAWERSHTGFVSIPKEPPCTFQR